MPLYLTQDEAKRLARALIEKADLARTKRASASSSLGSTPSPLAKWDGVESLVAGDPCGIRSPDASRAFPQESGATLCPIPMTQWRQCADTSMPSTLVTPH